MWADIGETIREVRDRAAKDYFVMSADYLETAETLMENGAFASAVHMSAKAIDAATVGRMIEERSRLSPRCITEARFTGSQEPTIVGLTKRLGKHVLLSALPGAVPVSDVFNKTDAVMAVQYARETTAALSHGNDMRRELKQDVTMKANIMATG